MKLIITLFFPVKFDNYMQQDAHEFFVQLIDSINETIMGKL